MPTSSKAIKLTLQLVCYISLISASKLQAQSWRPDWNYSYYQPYSYQNRMIPQYNPYSGYTQPYPAPANYYYQYPHQKAAPKNADKPGKTAPDAKNRKSQFVKQLVPIIQKENKRLVTVRYRIINTFILLNRGYQLKPQDEQWLKTLAEKYKVKGDIMTDINSRIELLDKVDIIPVSLALAQAANESAWGQSRFSREANNLFGIWTFDKNKGLKPKDRDEEKKHFVRKFEHIDESIQYYMLTLNSHAAYRKMRSIRQQLRNNEQPITGEAMAKGLEKYSEKGTEYVELIQKLIHQNDWEQLDRNV